MSNRSSSGRLTAVCRQLHAWAGLALSLVLLVLGLTGSALVYKDAWWRLVYPDLRGEPVVRGAAHDAAATEAAVAQFGASLRSVKFPEPGVNAYHLYLDEGEAFLRVSDYALIDEWRTSERLMSVLFDLHAHLMAGENGERVVGILGLLATLLVLTGLWLWWPNWRRLRLSNLAPRDLSRRALLLWHRDAGALATPILLIVILTGSGLVFYDPARVILGRLLPGDASPEASAVTPAVSGDDVAYTLRAHDLQQVQATFPDARMVFWTVPRDGSGVHAFRVKRPCDVHPNGRSTVQLSADSVRTFDACAAAQADRAVHAFYPLHAGKLESSVYRFLVFVSGLVLAALSASGVATYLPRITGRRVPSGASRGSSRPSPASLPSSAATAPRRRPRRSGQYRQ